MTTTVADSIRGAQSLDPHAIVAAVTASGITHVVTVPDTHQKSVLDVLAQDDVDLPLITVATEDDAMGVALGLYMGGLRPMLLIQNAGLYACMNTLRGLALDARLPLPMLVGEYFRDPAAPPVLHPSRVVNMLEPTLALWRVPTLRLDREHDLARFGEAVDMAWQFSCPVAVLVGAPTADLPG